MGHYNSDVRDVTTFSRTVRTVRATWAHHRDSGRSLSALVINSRWKRGPASNSGGPFMVSLTQYTPRHLTDVADIWRASEKLGDQLAEIDGAVGVMTYVQPGRRHVGSLSIWADDNGLTQFIKLPYHLEIMDKYRPRGLPIRSAKWWTSEFRVHAALNHSLQMLDTENERRRVVGPKLKDPECGGK